jgi:hypothetical protein
MKFGTVMPIRLRAVTTGATTRPPTGSVLVRMARAAARVIAKKVCSSVTVRQATTDFPTLYWVV